MIDLRKVVYQALREDAELATLVEDRIYQGGSTEEGQPPTDVVPYIVYKMSDSSQKGPSALRATAPYFAVWVHDVLGDYFQIDQILSRVKLVLEAVEPGEGLFEIRHIQTSPDLWDDLLKHIVRYGRYQATLSE